MAHHAAHVEPASGDFLPRSPIARALLISGFIVVILGLVVALWAAGGLEKAADPPTSTPGKPMKNSLLTVTPRSASVAPATESTKAALHIKADLVVHAKEPIDFFTVDDFLSPRVRPGGKLRHMRVVLDRKPDAFYSSLQPEVREKVTMSWDLPKKTDPEAVTDVTLTVLEAEYAPGFWDERSSWKSAEKDVGHIALPIGRG